MLEGALAQVDRLGASPTKAHGEASSGDGRRELVLLYLTLFGGLAGAVLFASPGGLGAGAVGGAASSGAINRAIDYLATHPFVRKKIRNRIGDVLRGLGSKR
ncbi:MAG: hypothetical protein HY319_24750 [Armatimonadetes bacterium]|nr:hypothetical protein [Armatimonadota bacterium]